MAADGYGHWRQRAGAQGRHQRAGETDKQKSERTSCHLVVFLSFPPMTHSAPPASHAAAAHNFLHNSHFLPILVLHDLIPHLVLVPCLLLLDIGYLCIQPRARMRVHEPLWCPFVGPRWVYALAGQYGKHMGRQACRAGDELAIGPLNGTGVAANILHACIWGIDGLG